MVWSPLQTMGAWLPLQVTVVWCVARSGAFRGRASPIRLRCRSACSFPTRGTLPGPFHPLGPDLGPGPALVRGGGGRRDRPWGTGRPGAGTRPGPGPGRGGAAGRSSELDERGCATLIRTCWASLCHAHQNLVGVAVPLLLIEWCVFLNSRDIRQGAHQYGKDWVPFGLLAESPVSALWLLFTIHLRQSGFLNVSNVSNVL